jgi:glycogen debranching enzyme
MCSLRKFAAVLLSLWLLAPLSTTAHHSFEMFDRGNPIQISGEIKEFQWVNPHSWIQIYVTDEVTGEAVEWSIEGRSPNVLVRRGWTRNTVLPGEKVTLTIYPLRNGEPGGAIVTVIKEDGTVINADTPTAVDTNEEGPR